MHLLTIPPGGRAKAHMHANHETAIYVLEGEAIALYGDRLQYHAVTKAGDLFYIPAGVPHLPINLSDKPISAVIARTDPNEQESVMLLPELEAYAEADIARLMASGDSVTAARHKLSLRPQRRRWMAWFLVEVFERHVGADP